MTSLALTLEHLAAAIEGYRFDTSSELDLCDGIERALGELRLQTVPVRREVRLGSDRLDFMIGSIGIEVKVDGSLSALTRQVHRYLARDEVHALLIVTTRSTHMNMPAEMNGKPLRVLHLIRSAL